VVKLCSGGQYANQIFVIGTNELDQALNKQKTRYSTIRSVHFRLKSIYNTLLFANFDLKIQTGLYVQLVFRLRKPDAPRPK